MRVMSNESEICQYDASRSICSLESVITGRDVGAGVGVSNQLMHTCILKPMGYIVS
jgi:hypothetical protein